MNETIALWPKLDLARERPFDLAGTQVRPAALEVETDGKQTALEPQVMKVLVALHRGRGHPVSRDQLIDICWGGRIITEAALNRCVARLRKVLAANPHVRLDTIATVGYRLQTSSETARPAAPAILSAPTAPGAIIRTWWVLALVAAGLAAAAMLAVFQLPRPMTWTVAAYRPLTTELGMETHPAISPGGQQLVYSQRLDSSVGRDLYLRNVDQGIPVRVTTNPGDDHSAAWSPAGDRIAFVRTTPDGPCTLLIAPMPAGPERVATRCQSARHTRVTWRNPTTLVFWDRPRRDTPWRIRTVDLTTGVAADLTSPPVTTLGDADPSVSPNGRYLVFRRSLLRGADDLFIKDLRNGRERALTTDGFRATGHVWSSDSRHIFYSSNRDGEFGLWTVDTARRDPPQRVSLGAGQFTFSRMSIDRRNRLAVEAPRIRTNITAMAPGGALTPITRTSSDDWAPRMAADGTVAYISNRSGAYELWIARSDGQPVRLTNIVGSYVHSPAWLPNGRMLSFVAVKGRRAEIYTINRDGSELRAVTDDGLDKLDPVWTPAGDALIYLQRTGAHYRLVRIGLGPGARPQAIAAGRDWRELRQGPNGRLFGLPLLGGTVEAMDGGPVPNVRIMDIDSWIVGRDGIYVLTGRGRAPPTAWLYPWTGAPRRLGELFSGGDIGVGPNGQVLISQSFNEQVDLGLFDLSPR